MEGRRFRLATLDAEIKDASARYAGMPYGVDALDARLVGQVDPMRREPSFCNLEIFRFRGAHTDILADAEVKNLLDDPLVSFHTKSAVDLTALAQTFPLQEGVALSGKLEAELRMSCRLSALRNRDLGRIRARGRVVMDSLALRDTARKFEFTSSASLSFAGDDRLDAEAEIRHASLRSPRLSSSMERLAATVRTTNPQDTTRIARMECTMTLNRLKAAAGDSLSLFCGRGTATVRLQPGKRDPAKPKVGLALEADTLFCRVGDSRMGMDRAGIGVTAEKLRDSVWIPEGIVGFSRLVVSTPQCALPIRMEKTSVTVGNRAVTLRNATMRIGRSDLTASGVVHDLYGAMRRRRPLARRAFAFVAESELQPTDPRRLVPGRHPAHRGGHRGHRSETLRRSEKHRLRAAHRLPPRALRQIRFRGRARRRGRPRRGRAPEGSAMKGLDAVMHTTLLYQAVRPERGYVGFDFRLRRINVGKLVEFTPSLDSIVPMLRSFRGTVDFDVSAEADLDSALNIRIPTLRSAIRLRGDSLVLMDGETFAEISKKFFFKNKERNLIDSIAVNISVKDGYVTVYPFAVAMDRYRAAVGGTQDLDMNFDYHISILKSPIPFKLGLNITGNLDDMKFRLGRAKYKNLVTPVEIHKVDSTVSGLGRQIVRDFKRRIGRIPEERRPPARDTTHSSGRNPRPLSGL